jgi:hypothetical protein
VGNQTALRGDEEGATENLQGDYSNDCHGFLTISDNTVCESTGSEEQAGWPHPHPGGLLEEAGGWIKNHMEVWITEVFQQRYELREKCMKIASGHVKKN